MLKGPSGTNWSFDEFQVMTEMRLLIAGGRPVPLTSKAFDTLVVLIENRDRVVTKDELLRSVWPDVEVEEGNLTQQIFLLRKALGETAQHPRYIITIPGHGYRFTWRANHDPCCLDTGANGGVVANVSNTLVSDLYVAPADRLNSLTQISSDHPVVGRHSWLPDNDTMVYRDLDGRVTAVRKDGRAFSLPAPEGQEATLGVSSCGDGRYVVFSAMPGKNIWRVTPDAGGGAVKLTSGFNDFNAACSPDGKWVLYVLREPKTKSGSLWQVSIEGGKPEPLNLFGYDVLPSPTGRMIFYQGSSPSRGRPMATGCRPVLVCPEAM
jgi:DNA-binding winged helix-turn-helix (wHTH) protein